MALIFFLIGGRASAAPSDVIVIGDTRFKPVQEVMAGIEEAMGRRVPVYSPRAARNKLSAIVRQHAARTVIALGRESLGEALTLPPSVTVLYALVILPPETDRPNTAGIYMGTPVREYLDVLGSYFTKIKKVSVIATPEVLAVLDNNGSPLVTVYKVRNAFDFVDTVKGLGTSDALLLLPDISLLTKSAVEESYLYSFRYKVPLLGISKKYVRQGALFALEFDPERVGRRLGAMVQESLAGQEVGIGKALPAQYFKLYVNRETARKMGITIPADMLERAAAVYP